MMPVVMCPRAPCLFVFLYPISRYMRPEGPWQRSAAAWKTAAGFPYMTNSCHKPLRVILGPPISFIPVPPDKREGKYWRPARSLLRHPPPGISPPAAPRPPPRPPLPSPGYLRSRPREGLTPCAPYVVGMVTSTPWPPVGPPSSLGTRWPGRGAVQGSFCAWPPHVYICGPA